MLVEQASGKIIFVTPVLSQQLHVLIAASRYFISSIRYGSHILGSDFRLFGHQLPVLTKIGHCCLRSIFVKYLKRKNITSMLVSSLQKATVNNHSMFCVRLTVRQFGVICECSFTDNTKMIVRHKNSFLLQNINYLLNSVQSESTI